MEGAGNAFDLKQFWKIMNRDCCKVWFWMDLNENVFQQIFKKSQANRCSRLRVSEFCEKRTNTARLMSCRDYIIIILYTFIRQKQAKLFIK